MRQWGTLEKISFGPYRCHFCPNVLTDKRSSEAQGWDWFTGYLPATVHCCPTCRPEHNAMWQELIRRSQIPKEPK